MKSWRLILLATLLLILIAVLSCACAEEETGILRFPSSIKTVEDHSFQGTAASIAVFPDGAAYIGDEAFADSPNLVAVYLPASVEHIGNGAFRGSKDLILFGAFDSYAQRWARENGYIFIPVDICIPPDQNGVKRRPGKTIQHYIMADRKPDVVFVLRQDAVDACMFNCPGEKPEMYPLDYDFP